MYKIHEIGKQGEDLVEKYLIKKGYKILDRNFSCKRGEIDIIAFYKKQIIFIEIKSRTNKKYGLPSEAVNKRKLEKIYKTAEYYLYCRNLENENIRIDVIEVYINEKRYYINHLKQVI